MRIPDRVLEILQLLALVLLAFGVYSNTLQGEFVLDDTRITSDPHIRLTSLAPERLFKIAQETQPTTRPISNISFGFNYYFHQYRVKGYHLTNIFIHITNGILLYFFIKLTLSLPSLHVRYREGLRWLPLATALIWLLHPLQTQSITYIIQRMNSIATMFYMLSMVCYIRGRLSDNNWGKSFLFGGSLIAGLLALGSKEIAFTLPIFILLYEWYFFQDLKVNWLHRRSVYLVAVLIIMTALTLFYLDWNFADSIIAGYKSRDFTMGQRLLTEFRVIVAYSGGSRTPFHSEAGQHSGGKPDSIPF